MDFRDCFVGASQPNPGMKDRLGVRLGVGHMPDGEGTWRPVVIEVDLDAARDQDPPSPPVAPSAATARGHAPVWDPPAALTGTSRWTCLCGRAVLKLRWGGSVYDSAVDEDCPLREETP
jgi:hypothetical protein